MQVEPEVISSKVKELVKPMILEMGYRLFDVEFKSERGWVLRIIIDKPQGVNIKDCEKVSKRVSALLDVEDPIPFSYLLEVSSPGLNRELQKEEHYDFFKGRLAKVVLREAVEGKRQITGYIEDVREGIIDIREKEKGELFHIPFSKIAKGRLEIEEW